MYSRLFNSCPLVLVAACLMAGIVVATYVAIPLSVLPVFVVMVVVAWLLYKFDVLQSIAVLLCCFLLGALLMQRHLASPADTMDEMRLERCKSVFMNERTQLLARLSAHGIDGDAYGVVAAMSLGDKSALSHDLKTVYAVSGASHVLALSGLHMGIIYMLLAFLLPRRRWPAVSQLVLLLGIWAFVFLVGMPVSAVRAAVMLSVYGLLSLGHRNKMSINTLAFAAILILLFSPATLFDVGFQMSFMAVWAILLFVPLFERVFPVSYRLSHPCVKWVWGMVLVSVSAQIGVAPLVAFYFGRFPVYFLLTNFIVVPAAFVILLLVMVVLLVPSLAYLLLYIVRGVNAVLLRMVTWPGASIEGLHPNVLQVVLIYVVILCFYLVIERIIPVAGWKPSRQVW